MTKIEDKEWNPRIKVKLWGEDKWKMRPQIEASSINIGKAYVLHLSLSSYIISILDLELMSPPNHPFLGFYTCFYF